MPRRLEQQVQGALVHLLDLCAVPGCWWTHFPGGGYRRPVEAKIFKALGTRSGVPDLLLVHRGHLYCLELKSGTGQITAVQKACHAALEAAGATVAVAFGLDAAVAQLRAWKLLKASAAITRSTRREK
jgi:hypothetical protein